MVCSMMISHLLLKILVWSAKITTGKKLIVGLKIHQPHHVESRTN